MKRADRGIRPAVSRPQTHSTRAASVRNSFWLIPACFATGSVLLAVAMSTVELRLVLPLGDIVPGGPAGARALLSAIITAMISFTALVFSITVVALQLAASQYSPRILRTFIQDRVIQTALGLFIATFLFAIIVLASLPDQPRADQSQPGLPQLSLSTSLLLVLGSSGMFVWYLQHVTTIMRVSHIIAAIGSQTRRSIDAHYTTQPQPDPPVPSVPPGRVIPSNSTGAISDIALDRLATAAATHNCLIRVIPKPGDFVVAGDPLLAVHPTDPTAPPRLPRGTADRTITIGPERSPGQDIGFGFRQLADIAERALSPGVNDLTTAVRAIQESHDLLRRLVSRPDQPQTAYDAQGQLRVVAPRQSFGSFLAIAIDDVAHAGRDQPRITSLLHQVLTDLSATAAAQHHAAINRCRTLLARNSPAAHGPTP